MNVVIKTPEQIAKMREAGKLAAEVLEMIGEHVKAGVTTEELDRICHDHIVNKPVSYTHLTLPTTPSVNHVVCHGIPNDRKALKNGDIINIDVTVIKDGWHGDTSKMFYVGEPSVLDRRLVETTRECMLAGIKMVKPGARLGDIGHRIQKMAEGERFSVVREYCGHGIGEGFHEEPQVVHYGKPGTGLELQEGMVFTIEPMINAGKAANKLLPDNWTVVTKDRKLSAQWEHTIAVTADGYEVLTARSEETDLY